MKSRLILLLPPHRLWTAWTGTPPGTDEDREFPYRILAARGIATTRRLDLTSRPWNPFDHTLLRAIDPVRAFRVLLFERDAELVLCFFESASLLILLLRRLFRFRGKVVVIDVGAPGWKLRDWILARVIPRADAVMPYSARQAELIRQSWPHAQLVQSVRPQVDCRLFSASPDSPAGPILAIGDDHSRDYPTFLRAVNGVDHPILVRSRVLAPSGAVTVLSTPLSVPAYRDLIAAACMIVLPLRPSDYAGGTSVLVQAMASGKPLVVSDSQGLRECVTHEVDALVVPCGDAAAMHAAILRLLSDPALRQRLGTAARRRAERDYSLEAWADQIGSIVDRLFDRPLSAGTAPEGS